MKQSLKDELFHMSRSALTSLQDERIGGLVHGEGAQEGRIDVEGYDRHTYRLGEGLKGSKGSRWR